MELSPIAKVILGMIAFGKRTGYEIKQFVDRTARHFMAASYGQIYPELRRLEVRGLIAGKPRPSGGRARTVYELTAAGRAALERWLRSDEEPLFELRDEGMLKLFFSDALPERRIENLRAMRRRNGVKLAQLRALEPTAAQGPEGGWLTLQLGITLMESVNAWCEATERMLAEGRARPAADGEPG
jgi:DNA-binding PadR family transcriptional regulator